MDVIFSNYFKIMILITNNASGKIKELQLLEQKTNSLLRISVIGGGCSGLSYKLNFEESPTDTDKVININNINIVVDNKSALYLKGLKLDYFGGLNGSGFAFNNPNATNQCGCGTSFQVKT